MFFDIAVRQMKDLYKIISGDGFAMVLADHEGYILHLIGDAAALDRLSKVNCAPGFRWSERDVGTTSIALSIARKIPVQITETESFCRRGRGYTNSAAPIFDSEDRVLGTVATTTNTIRSYRSYTALYPQGRFTVEAENKISNLRTDKAPYEAALRIGSEASLKSFLTDYPGHQKESEVQQAAKDITEGRDIVDLLNDKKIEIATQGSGIEYVNVRIRKLVPYPITVRVPAGTYFVSARQSAQNMVTTAESKIRLNTH